MLGRRLLVLVAVLMGLTALAASLAPPPQQDGRTPDSSPTPAPTEAPSAAPADAGTVRRRLAVGSSAVPREVTAERGQFVMLTVAGDVVDTVSIPGLAVLEPIDPDSPARVELLADSPGRYAIRLLGAERRIGTLRITG